MPAFEIRNMDHVKELAKALDLPPWLVKVIIVEYLPCRRFEGVTNILDYGLVTVEDFRAILRPYVVLNGLSFFHNVTDEVLTQRILSAFGGYPMTALTKHEYLFTPEGKISPHCLPNPIRNSDEVEGDWKLRLNLHKRAIVLDEDGLYQWQVTTNALIPADISQQWYESNVFSTDELEELRRINKDYLNINQFAASPEIAEQHLKKLYEDLEVLHIRMRQTLLDYHLQSKNKPEARLGYTEEAPPQLTLFDEFTLMKVREGASRVRRFKVRSYVEPLFFRAAYRASKRAREVREGIDAGAIYPIPIAEEIEAAAESIILSAMCLEAYINGFVQDHLSERADYIERMETRAKWLIVPALLGKADCFNPGSLPFDNFSQLIKWRNDDLAHYKHEFRFPVSLGTLGSVSELHSICNADNSEKAVKTVREMVRQLNENLSLPIPAWIEETIAIQSWLMPVEIVKDEVDER